MTVRWRQPYFSGPLTAPAETSPPLSIPVARPLSYNVLWGIANYCAPSATPTKVLSHFEGSARERGIFLRGLGGIALYSPPDKHYPINSNN